MDHLIAIADKLHPNARVGQKINQLLHSPLFDMADLARLVRMDAALSGRILSVCNSIAFKGSEPIESVDVALTRLGVRQVSRYAGFAIASKLYTDGLPHYGVDSSTLLKNSIATAQYVTALAHTAHDDERVGYTLGLMRSLGYLIFEAHLHNNPAIVVSSVSPNGSHPWEIKTFGCTGEELTAAVLTRWDFEPGLCAGLENHIKLPASDHFSALLHVACFHVTKDGFGLPFENHFWRPSAGVYETLGLTPAVAQQNIDKTRPLLEKILISLGC